MAAKLIDLSGPLRQGMWSYGVLPEMAGWLPEFSARQLSTVREQGFESFGFALSSLTGTYIETGAHMLEGVPPLSDLPLERFVLPAVVCHLPAKGPEELIHGDELAAHCPPVRPGDALLIECGWGRQWSTPGYVKNGPAYHYDCLPWLLAQPFSLLGVDVPCIESARSRPDGSADTGNMLVPLFERGMLLLAPLVNLHQIAEPRGELIALPLNIQDVSGSPCRAIWRSEV